MKTQQLAVLEETMEEVLANIDKTTGNPQLCDPQLAIRMAKAAALVYDSCMEGQAFAKTERL